MVPDRAVEPAPPGRQALILLAGVIGGLVLGTAAGAPFNMDVGAGHPIFHVVLAGVVGLAAWWLSLHGTTHAIDRIATQLASGRSKIERTVGIIISAEEASPIPRVEPSTSFLDPRTSSDPPARRTAPVATTLGRRRARGHATHRVWCRNRAVPWRRPGWAILDALLVNSVGFYSDDLDAANLNGKYRELELQHYGVVRFAVRTRKIYQLLEGKAGGWAIYGKDGLVLVRAPVQRGSTDRSELEVDSIYQESCVG